MEDGLYKVTAFDPGGVTGWAAFAVREEAMHDPRMKVLANLAWWQTDEFFGDENKQAQEMIHLTDAWDDAHIVVEDFLLRKLSTDREMLAPVRVTARFEYGLFIQGDPRTIILQPGDLAMSTVTDDRLIDIGKIRSLGFYNATRGKKDARDAVRHALTWLRRAKKIIAIQDATRDL